MGQTTLKMDTRRALSDGSYPIIIKVGYGTNIYLPTNVHLKRDEWHAGMQVCTGRTARAINNILATKLRNLINRILELRETGQFYEYSRAQLRQMLMDPTLSAPTAEQPTLGEYLEKIMSLKAGNTLKIYQQAVGKLSAYCDPSKLRLIDINGAWLEKYVTGLKNEGLKQNSRSKYLQVLKTTLRYAEESGVRVHPDYKKLDCRMEKDTPMRNMPVETFRRIRDLSLRGSNAVYRDAFLLSFYLIGINMADLLALPQGCIVNGRLQYKRAKTKKNYSIKITPEAQTIIDRYPGRTHLLSFSEQAREFRRSCDRFLRSLAPGLSWYWARYSWANYAVDLDIPKDTISEALGHNHGSTVTGIYIRYALDKVDEANRRVTDYTK